MRNQAVTPQRDRAAYMRSYRQLRKKKSRPEMVAPAGDLFDWIEALKVPSGPLRGQPFRLPDWQRSFLDDALAPGVREAGLSVSRKSGKSHLIGALLLAHLAGVLNRPLWRGVVVSLTGALAVELRMAIEQLADASGLADQIEVRRSPFPGRVIGLQGSELTILASDKATGHALGADLAVIDEAGLLQEDRRYLWQAVYSSTSGRDGRCIYISIQGDSPMFRELQARQGQPGIVWHQFTAPEGCDLDDEAAWHAANPGLKDGIKSLGYMKDAAQRALANPSDAAGFRAHDLNQPQSPTRETLCAVEDWRKVEVGGERLGPAYLGVDLGGSSSMACASSYWPESGYLQVWGAFPGVPPLLARSRADGMGETYLEMERRAELKVYQGLRVTPVDEFLFDVQAHLDGVDLRLIGGDRYRGEEFTDVIERAFPGVPIETRGVGRGSDGSSDIRSFQKVVYSGKLRANESLMMRSAIAESEIIRDSNGNAALNKSRARGRIDALQASVIAVGMGEREHSKPVIASRYHGLV